MNAYVLEDEDWRVQFFVKIGVPRERIFREPKALLGYSVPLLGG